MKQKTICMSVLLLITGLALCAAQKDTGKLEVIAAGVKTVLTPEQRATLEKLGWLTSRIHAASQSLYKYKKPLAYGLAGLAVWRGGIIKKGIGIGAIAALQRYDKESSYHFLAIKKIKAQIWVFFTTGLKSSKIIQNITNLTAARLKKKNFPPEFLNAKIKEQVTFIQPYTKAFDNDIATIESYQKSLRFYIDDEEVYTRAFEVVANVLGESFTQSDLRRFPEKRSLQVEAYLDKYMKELQSPEKSVLFGLKKSGGKFEYSHNAAWLKGYKKLSYTKEVVQIWWRLQKLKETLERAKKLMYEIITPQIRIQTKETFQQKAREVWQESTKRVQEHIQGGWNWAKGLLGY